jgi:predicted nucleic acid-binding protein
VKQIKLNIINTDEDDNKFVGCVFAANADYIVTNDNDFSILKKVSFPKIKVGSIDEFKNIFIEKNILE